MQEYFGNVLVPEGACWCTFTRCHPNTFGGVLPELLAGSGSTAPNAAVQMSVSSAVYSIERLDVRSVKVSPKLLLENVVLEITVITVHHTIVVMLKCFILNDMH